MSDKFHVLKISDKERIEVRYTVQGSGNITTFGLRDNDVQTENDDREKDRYNAAIDAIEALILAQACAGINITTAKYRDALETALEAIVENFC